MAKRFTPVVDPERARCEQDEESLRKHRQFDTPFALLPKNLNDPKHAKEDLKPLGKQSEELYLDANKLWRKKTELFDKQKTWGRETFEYSNPEEARAEGSNADRKWRPGDVGWGVRGSHGGRGEDNGHAVLQRGEVDQTLVKNDKGLWVKRKAQNDAEAEDGERRSPTPKGGWRCPKCKEGNSRSTYLCKACGIDRSMYEHYKSRPGEDPRLEAAKPKGRGTADAQAKALQALEDRRRKERAAKEDLGLTRRPAEARGRPEPRGAAYVPLNSSSQQVRSAKRSRRLDNWQGVQRSDQDAARIVGKALGHANSEAQPVRLEDRPESVLAAGRARPAPASPLRRSPSPRSSSRGSSRSRSPASAGRAGSAREPSAPRDGGEAVDFF